MAKADDNVQEQDIVEKGQDQAAPQQVEEPKAAEQTLPDEQAEQTLPDEQAEQALPDEQAETEEKFQCSVRVEDSGPWKKKISVEIPRKEIDKELDRQYAELRWKAEVPGFRKGRAPRRLIEKRYGKDLSDQAKMRLMAQAFEQIEEDQDFEVLGEIDFDPEKVEMPPEGDFNWGYEVEVKPEFELPGLEGVRIEKPLFEVTEQRVAEAIEQLRKRQGRLEEITDGGAKEDDMVRADVVMKVEGVDEEERQENCSLRVGPTVVLGVYVEDMAKTLEGAEIGQVKSCRAEISDTYEKEEYRGKKAEFNIEVKGMSRLIPAELNERFFAGMGLSDEEELKQRIEEGLEQQAENEIRRMMAQQVYKYLDEKVEIELPEGVAARHADRFLARRYYELLQQGIAREMIEENLEKLRASSSEEANRQLKMSFVMDEVAQKLQISVSEAEVNGVVAQIAGRYGRRPERVKEELEREGRLESLKNQIRDERAVDKILEMAEVVDAPVKQPQAEPKKRKPRPRKSAGSDRKTEGEEAKAKKSTAKAKKAEKNNAAEMTAEKKTTKMSPRKQVKRKPPAEKADE